MSCCANPSLQWTTQTVNGGPADALRCDSCGTVNKVEQWAIPWVCPVVEDQCVNCGMRIIPTRRRGAPVLRGEPKGRCETCQFTPEETSTLHEQLVAAHPEKNYLKAAEMASESGRHVLATKLATAAWVWGTEEDRVVARVLRIESMASLGRLDAALDDAYVWSEADAPMAIWSIIAELERRNGNWEACGRALKYALRWDPNDVGTLLEYTDVLLHFDDRREALDVIDTLLEAKDAELYANAVALLCEVGDRYESEGEAVLALEVVSRLAEKINQHPAATWLSARVAARQEDPNAAVKWLERTLELDPDHAEAAAALERLRPKRRWFW
jgi:tetratricopeptide (TPR) repeat protein